MNSPRWCTGNQFGHRRHIVRGGRGVGQRLLNPDESNRLFVYEYDRGSALRPALGDLLARRPASRGSVTAWA
ncbi:hypothetical protein AB0D27_18000 [Streptomyces sp. NPDC048415]|uniref:hypothetical protein n=1 Tax=Streptomyces sp. NPDC048415 TaxID=3154822 RepID=UPI00342ECAE3